MFNVRIATQFAGNRQQSRFLALVSNVDLLKQNIQNAENSEDVGTLQTLKALDSLESKLNQVQVAYQQFYTTIGIEDVWKALLDSTRTVIDTLNGLPKIFGKLPVNAAAVVYSVIQLIKTVALNGFSSLATEIHNRLEEAGRKSAEAMERWAKEGGDRAKKQIKQATDEMAQHTQKSFEGWNKAGQVISTLGNLSVTIGALIDKSNELGRTWSGITTAGGGFLQITTSIIQAATGHWPAAIMSFSSGLLNIINGFSIGIESAEEKIDRLSKEAENLTNESKKVKAEYNTLNRSVEKIKELTITRNQSVEATEEYYDAVNELADSFPQLIINFDDAGNAIIDLNSAELLLIESRRQAAAAAVEASKAEQKLQEEKLDVLVAKEVATINNIIEQFSNNIQQQFDTTWQTGLLSNVQEYNTLLKQVIAFGDNTPLGDIYKNYGRNNFARGVTENYDSLIEFYSNSKAKNLGAYTPKWIIDRLNDIKESYSVEVVDTINEEQQAILETLIKFSSFTSEDFKNKDIQREVVSINNDINNYIQKYGYDNFITTLLDEEHSIFLDAINGLQDIQIQQAKVILAERKTAVAEIGRYNTFEWSENSSLNALAASIAYNDKNTYETEAERYLTAIFKINDWWDNFDNQTEALFALSNLKNYSLNDLYKIINTTDEELILGLKDYYETTVGNISNQILEQQKQNGLLGKAIAEGKFDSQLGLSLVTEAFSLLTKYENKGLEKNAQDLRIASAKLFDILGNISEENTSAFVALEQIIAQGFSTKEQIETAKELIKQNQEAGLYEGFEPLVNDLITILDEISSNIFENYLIKIQASADSTVNNYKNDIKEIDKLIKGLNFTDLLDFLNSSLNTTSDVQLSIQDFVRDASGTYHIVNERMNQFWQAYIDKNFTIAQELQDLNKIETAEEILNSADKQKLLYALNLSADLTEENTEEIEAALKNYHDLYEAYELELDEMKKAAIHQLNFDAGNYDAIVGDLAELAKNKNLGKDDFINRAAKESLNKAYSSLISDVLSKGFSEINLADYTGLINGGKGIDLTDSYTNFVTKYIDYAGLTLEEANDLMLQAIEKEQEQTVGASEVLKDVTFIKKGVAFASKETIGKLATLFGLKVADLFDPDNYNSIFSGYQIDLSKIPGLDKITDAKQMMEDSIASYFQSVANLISTGLAGKLTSANRDELLEALKQYNIDLELQFTKTAEGLKLSTDSAIALYNELNKVDAIQGNLLFKELRDALEQSGKDCENITKTLSSIKKLEKELEKPGNENNEILKERLSLYKQIAVEQSQESKQFDFMNRSMPGNLQGVAEYWSAGQEALDAIANAKSSGYMDLQDYYRIVNEIAYSIEETNGRIVYLGQEYATNAELAAALIKAGNSALTNVVGKGMQVALSQVGQNIGLGADQMSTDIRSAMKTMADEQIAMLESQVQFLKGIQALEELNFADRLGEIFESGDKILIDEKNFSSSYEELINELMQNETIADALGHLFMPDGTSVAQILSSPAKAWEVFEGDAEKFKAFLKQLQKWTDNFDWNTDPDDIQQKLNDWIESVLNAVPDKVEKETIVEVTPDVKTKNIDNPNALLGIGDEVFSEKAAPIIIKGNKDTVPAQPEQKVVEVIVEYKDTETGLQELINALKDEPLERLINVKVPQTEEEYKVQVQGIIQDYAEKNGLQISQENLKQLNKLTGYVYKYLQSGSFGEINPDDLPALQELEGWLNELHQGGQLNQEGIDLLNTLHGTLTEIKDAGENTDISKITAKDKLVGKINSLIDAAKVNITGLTQKDDLEGTLTSYKDSDNPDLTKLTKKDDLEGQISYLKDATDIDLTGLTKKDSLEGILTKYKEEGTLDSLFGLGFYYLNHIWGKITHYEESGSEDNLLSLLFTITRLTGWITGYNENGEKSKLIENLKAIFGMTGTVDEVQPGQNGINSSAVEAAINALQAGISNFYANWGTENNPDKLISTLIATVIGVIGLAEIAQSQVKDLPASIGDVQDDSLRSLTGQVSIVPIIGQAAQLVLDTLTGFALISGNLTKNSQKDLNEIKGAADVTAELTLESQDYLNNLPSATEVDTTLNTDGLETGLNEFSKTHTLPINTILVNGKNLNEPISFDEYKKLEQAKQIYNETQDPEILKYLNDFGIVLDENGKLINSLYNDNAEASGENTVSFEENTTSTEANTKAVDRHSEALGRGSKKANAAGALLQIAGEKAKAAGTKFGNLVTSDIALNAATKQLANTITSAINRIAEALKNLPQGTSNAKGTITKGKTPPSNGANFVPNAAKGNVALAGGRNTLMGELGEELWVSNGHYYIAGANGPEFVNLPDDAIVFNHLQTKHLMQNGSVSTHGKPVTNERTAVSYAAGTGPAKASTSETIAVLEGLIAAWKQLRDASTGMLGKLAGSGSKGGGGKSQDVGAYVKQIERWYNLLKQIDKLEKDINYQETLRAKLQSDLNKNGTAIYETYRKQLDINEEQLKKTTALYLLQKEQYEESVAQLNDSVYGKFFEFKDGILQLKSGDENNPSGLSILGDLFSTDKYGVATKTAKEQYDIVAGLVGDNLAELLYKDDGTKIDINNPDKLTDEEYKTIVENFISKLDNYKEDIETQFNDLNETQIDLLNLESDRNNLLKEIQEQQIELQNQMLEAVVEREQTKIDNAKKELDALKEANEAFLNGLSNQLSKERQMYQNNKEEEDLNKLRRRLLILQRSGGSASQIHSLQQEIDSKSQEMYFDKQQQQIDALKEASDLEIERLDRQIEIMEETLEFQKANGLLWDEVKTLMQTMNPAEIATFVTTYNPKYKEGSTEDKEQLLGEAQSLADFVKTAIKDAATGLSGSFTLKASEIYDAALESLGKAPMTTEAKEKFDKIIADTGSIISAINGTTIPNKNGVGNEGTPNTGEPREPQEPEHIGGQTNTTATTTTTTTTSSGNLSYGSYGDGVKVIQRALTALGYQVGGIDGKFGQKTKDAVMAFQAAQGLVVDGIVGEKTRAALLKKFAPGYSEGGLVDYTGLAMVHGSKNRPESYLDADDTKLLKQDLLMRQDVLPDLLDAYKLINANSTSSNYNTSTTDTNTIQVDKIEVNLQVDSIANDYDAGRAAEQVANKLLSIARKSGTLGINRR